MPAGPAARAPFFASPPALITLALLPALVVALLHTLGPALLPVGALPAELIVHSLLLAPWLEEIVFRFGLQDALSRARSPWLARHAGLLTAAAFGLAHAALAPPTFPWPLALSTALPAWWIGRDYRRHRSLLRCIAWHAWFNAAWLLGVAPHLFNR